jgi:hypothetical protein
MTHHTQLAKAALAIIAVGAMSIPAMAGEHNQQRRVGEYRTPSGKECAIGETYNGGSISSLNRRDKDTEKRNFDPNDCNNVNRLTNW